VQLASGVIFSRAAASASLPAKLPADLGIRSYAAIERVAPAPYVEAMLAQASLERGELQGAQSYAERLPESPARADLLGRIAHAAGDQAAAQRYFLAANDVFAIRSEVNRLAKRDQVSAYNLELRLTQRLQSAATHPDALADAYWELGRLATQRGYADAGQRREWFKTGMHDYVEAVALAPFSERYLIYAGSQALNLDDPRQARAYFKRAADQNPASADAYAGLGVAAFRTGDATKARTYAQLSRSYDPHSHFLHTLEALLK
jgi:tetratricopeptide (TPR) repeat protein